MTARRKTAVAARPASPRMTIAEVPPGHFARLADGALVRRAPDLNGWPLVRDDAGLRPMRADTPVLESIAPSLEDADRSAVADPLAGTADRETDLFRTEAA